MITVIHLPDRNFGDIYNQVVFPYLFPSVQFKFRRNPIGLDPSRVKLIWGCGTLIDFCADVNMLKYPDFEIFVAGTGTAKFEEKVELPRCKGWVRGPRSSSKTGLPGYGDLGLLMNRFVPEVKNGTLDPITVFDWYDFRLDGVENISANCGRNGVVDLIKRIKQAEYVITDRMHIAICAEAVKTPWLFYWKNIGKTQAAKIYDFIDTVGGEPRYKYAFVEDLALKNSDYCLDGKLNKDAIIELVKSNTDFKAEAVESILLEKIQEVLDFNSSGKLF